VELYNLYSFSDIVKLVKSRRVRWSGLVARMGEDRKLHKVLVEKTRRIEATRNPERRWKDGIRMELKEIGWCLCVCGVDSVGSE
jgi:hypothetical protein